MTPSQPLTDLAALMANTHKTPKVVPTNVKHVNHVMGALTNVIT
ncbi:Nicotinamide Mononucleotide Transporter [Levilactobacillus brevis KB290]|uniref:Nicotinamide Mononucleotide Transporter n=1 Tax=Levilactobacillus brevis KB290 TaxID=1001583 RepID=M5ACC4_LEVBR|nr:Nicotinamide Mononucleotide Transporter [Levilactobacillus brevis KB290]